MKKPKYKVGNRLCVMQHVEIEIIRVIESFEPAYIFQLVKYPSLKSTITETKLIEAITA